MSPLRLVEHICPAVLVGLVLCWTALFASATSFAQEARPIDRATEAFQHKRYREAAGILEALYQADGNPLHLYNIGRAYEEEGDYELAWDHFTRYLRTAPAAKQRARAEAHLARVEPLRPAWLELESNVPGAEVRVDGVPVCTTPCRKELPPGPHMVEVLLEGYRTQLLMVEMAPEQHHAYKLELLRPLPLDRPGLSARVRPALPWVLTGLGAAAGVTGGYLFYKARDLRQSVSSAETNADGEIVGMSQEKAFQLRGRADACSMAGGALTGAGGAAFTAGLAWGMYDLASGSQKSRPRATLAPEPQGGLSVLCSVPF